MKFHTTLDFLILACNQTLDFTQWLFCMTLDFLVRECSRTLDLPQYWLNFCVTLEFLVLACCQMVDLTQFWMNFCTYLDLLVLVCSVSLVRTLVLMDTLRFGHTQISPFSDKASSFSPPAFSHSFCFFGLPSSFPVPSSLPSAFVLNPQLFVSLYHRVNAAGLPNFCGMRLAVLASLDFHVQPVNGYCCHMEHGETSYPVRLNRGKVSKISFR